MRWLAAAMAVACVALILLGVTGCCMDKNVLLGAYEHVLQFTGQLRLTPAIRLQGVRSFGESRALGSYRAECEHFSGTEYLFGGASLNARSVLVSARVVAREGEGTLFLLSGSAPAQVLCENSRRFCARVELPAGSCYIGFTGRDFTGAVEIEIAPAQNAA